MNVHSLFSSAVVAATFATVVGAAPAVHAYSVESGDMLLKPVVGASVNALRYTAATRATPPGGMLLGADFDWHVAGGLALTAQLRPVVSSNFIDGNLGVGVKYRVTQLGAPFIPYGSAVVVGAVGGPLGYGDIHTNAGLRIAGGVDYFILRDVAVGIEMAGEGTVLITPIAAPEASTDVLFGVTWRL